MELPLGNLVWSTIDLFIIHSLLTSAKKKKKSKTTKTQQNLEAAEEQCDSVLEFWPRILILVVSNSLGDLGQLT